ncbi:MAG: NUDIX hydrolase N-terminal domain-containing protein [Succinivibrio sp.]|nr:NUDIX hydrolase N-terminal domain-containing protein [Succinivibrio sp.]
MKHYRHILFDLDGTLYDSVRVNLLPLLEVLDELKAGHQETLDSLMRFGGSPADATLQGLGFREEEYQQVEELWFGHIGKYLDQVKIFPQVDKMLERLSELGLQLGIITSRDRQAEARLGDAAAVCPQALKPYVRHAISCDDVEHGKPSGDSIRLYLEKSGAAPEEVLYIGDTEADRLCAHDAGVDFALACWGTPTGDVGRCEYYFLNPLQLTTLLEPDLKPKAQWFDWAREIQALSQIGLTYTTNPFDKERFLRLREIAGEMVSKVEGESFEAVRQAFMFDRGYITPKLDTRAAVFNDQGEILLVKERKSGLWNLPGGWCDEDQTIFSNTVKEVREEAGLYVNAVRLIAILDRNRHNPPAFMYGVLKFFVLCSKGEGNFVPNLETTERAYFAQDKIPYAELRVSTTSPEQLQLCFAAYHDPNWQCIVE